MDLSQESLLKCFYSSNERLECNIQINTKSKKKKKRVLALTVSLNTVIAINIYILKTGDKGDLKRKLITNAKNLVCVNCHDYDGLPSFDIEFKCVDGKIKRIFALLIEDKHRFVERLMRCIYLHDVRLLGQVQFTNLPPTIDRGTIYTDGSAIQNDRDEEMTQEEYDPIEVLDIGPYRNLSSTEEGNLLKFLNESPDAIINAAEFQETLNQHLLVMESINVQSILSSEKQVLELMRNFDLAMEHVEQLEYKFNKQDQLLAEVEESMGSLHDRDELVRLTSHNRDQFQATLEQVLYQLTISEVHVYSLLQIDFQNKDSVKPAIVAADKLRLLLEQPTIVGAENMKAVRERTEELNRLADEFSRKIATQFNSALMRHINRLVALSTNNLDTVIEFHRASRADLLQYADFMVWLKASRPRSFLELQKVYIDKMAMVYDHEIGNMVEIIKNKLVNRNVSGNTNKTNAHQMPMFPVIDANPDSLDIIFEDFLCKLKPLVLEEEEFLTCLFRLDCRRAMTRPSPANNNPEQPELSLYLVKFTEQVFRHLSSQLSHLIQLLEQHDSSLSLLMVVVVNRQYEELVRASEFLQNIWSVLFLQSKVSFNGYIDRFVTSFREYKAPKKLRCGILPFVMSYASFAQHTALTLQDCERQNDLITAHQKIVREIIIQIKRVAEESMRTPKEVILMENHHQMIDILRHLKWPELEELHGELRSEYRETLDNYVVACVGRPFEKLYMFFEDIGRAIESGVKDEDIGYQFAFNKTALRKVLHEYPGKEVKKGLESLCKKVEKYVSEESGLFQVIWISMQKQFMAECLRYEALIDKCYPNSHIKLEFTAAELEQYFVEIAFSR